MRRIVRRKYQLTVIALVGALALTGCGTPDKMPAPKVDIFVLDLSGSNDKTNQLNRLNEDFQASLTNNPLGVPKATSNNVVSGPVTTIFTFIQDVALKAETFKIQDANSTIKLWNTEFAKDKSRNARSWEVVSSTYDNYLRTALEQGSKFSYSDCVNNLDEKLSPLFNSDSKRTLIITPLCEKISTITSSYLQMIDYVQKTNAPATDVFGSLAKIDRLVSQIYSEDGNSQITVNFASDMQHETGDRRDIPGRLKNLNFEANKVCEMARKDRIKEALTLDSHATVKVNGIGNASRISAQSGSALVRYWECFFNQSAEIR